MRNMKFSGVEWIGEIPEDWKVIRIKYLCNKEENSFQDGDWIESPFITDTGIRYLTTGNVGDGTFKHQGNGYISEDTFAKLNCKYAYPDDLVISRLNAPYGRACILPFDEEKYVLAVDIVILRTDHNKRYLCYLMQCQGYQNTVQDIAKGTTMKRISRTNLGNISLPIAPLVQQRLIADYLDSECSRIDSVIEQTCASIEEYKKLKQAVIKNAVTKGIRPNREMKDSGIEWIGEMPVNWELAKLSYFFDIQLGKMLQPESSGADDTLEFYLCAANLGGNRLKMDSLRQMWFSPNETMKFSVRKGDLLVVEGGDVASCDIIADDVHDIYIQNALHRVRSKAGYDLRLLRYYLIFAKACGYIDLICNKATIAHFTKDKFSSMPYPVIPIEEQREIADYLDKKSADIESLINQKTVLLEELETYKKSLIFEYVTGKKEVPA